jgi:hypothetical protein
MSYVFRRHDYTYHKPNSYTSNSCSYTSYILVINLDIPTIIVADQFSELNGAPPSVCNSLSTGGADATKKRSISTWPWSRQAMQLEGVGTSKSAAADLRFFLHWVSGFCLFSFQYLSATDLS